MLIQLQLGPETQQTIRTLGEMGRSVAAAVQEGLGIGAHVAAGNVSRNYLKGQALKHRTGRLSAAVQGILTGPGEATIGVPAGTAVDKYQWLLGDEQKTISAKPGHSLAIPFGENLSGAGVPQFFSPRDAEASGKDLFPIKTKRSYLLGYKVGKKGRFRTLFVLVKSVFVQGSGALFDGVEESIPDMTAAIQKSVEKAIAS